MNLQLFFDNFALLADAPNGVSKLRELILQLAVEGKLISKDPHSKSVTVLLRNVSKEKERLIREAKLTNKRPLPEIKEDEFYFKLPKHWVWVRMGEIVDQRLGKMLDKGKNKGKPYQYLRNTNVQWLRFDLSDVKEMRFEDSELEEYEVRPGDLLVCEGGEPGRCAIWDGQIKPIMFQKAIHRIRPFADINSWYLLYCLLAGARTGNLEKHFTGATIKHLTGQELAKYVIGLPPLEEQNRIVAKVDELMRLCDELEARQQQRRESRVRLNNAMLAPMNNAASLGLEEFEQACTRLADNFNALYDSSDTVSRLRATILKLAVQGKLVPQVPKDAPAAVLLEKIRRGKARLGREKKTQQPEQMLPVEQSKAPFRLPSGWLWTRFGDVTINRDGERIPLERSVRQGRQGIYDYYGASGVIDKIDDYLFDKPLLLIGEDGANLINRSTPIAFIAKGKYWVNNHAHVLDSLTLACLEYLEVFINAIDLRPYITGTAQPKMNQAKMNSILVALAPEEEQKRIVAKVNQLMALCDELEAKLRQTEADGERLMKAAVRHLLESVGQTNKEEAAFLETEPKVG